MELWYKTGDVTALRDPLMGLGYGEELNANMEPSAEREGTTDANFEQEGIK